MVGKPFGYHSTIHSCLWSSFREECPLCIYSGPRALGFRGGNPSPRSDSGGSAGRVSQPRCCPSARQRTKLAGSLLPGSRTGGLAPERGPKGRRPPDVAMPFSSSQDGKTQLGTKHGGLRREGRKVHRTWGPADGCVWAVEGSRPEARPPLRSFLAGSQVSSSEDTHRVWNWGSSPGQNLQPSLPPPLCAGDPCPASITPVPVPSASANHSTHTRPRLYPSVPRPSQCSQQSKHAQKVAS